MNRVLVADDASFMRLMIRQILVRRGGFEIMEAGNGLTAIELYKKQRPDLVILDITMPEADGLQVLSEILTCDATARVIMCSALAQGEIVKEAMRRGASDFIVKPFCPDDLVQVVCKYLTCP
ncbi:chemotaxis protein CheY [Peptococcaceae bacterium CEB3]|nr:chemotaxis protein CheY [Peptococcaceae bacterium CEB3]